jgi:endonuclease III
MIKAMAEVLHRNPAWPSAGLLLLAAVDRIDLAAVETHALRLAAQEGLSRSKAVADELERVLSAELWLRAAE